MLLKYVSLVMSTMHRVIILFIQEDENMRNVSSVGVLFNNKSAVVLLSMNSAC